MGINIVLLINNITYSYYKTRTIIDKIIKCYLNVIYVKP